MGGVCFVRVFLPWARWPEYVKPYTVFSLGLLYIDPVCRHPGSLYAAVSGVHQSDYNPNIDVSTSLRLGLLPLGVQATV